MKKHNTNTNTNKGPSVGDSISINHRGRIVTGTITEILPTSSVGLPFILKTARREYGCLMREDGFAWVAC